MQPFIVSGHTYFTHNNDEDTVRFRNQVKTRSDQFNVKVYSSEWCALRGGDGFPNVNTYYRNALFNAKLTHQDITIAGAVSYSYWTALCKDVGHARYGLLSHFPGAEIYDANANRNFSFFDEKGLTKTQSTLWGTGHYSLFVRPGFQRMGLSSKNINTDEYMGLMGTAYISPDGFREFNPASGLYDGDFVDRIVLVYVNMAAESIKIIGSIDGNYNESRIYGGHSGKYPKFIRVYMTNFDNTEAINTDGPASGYGMRRQPHDNGIFLIPKESIVTVVYDF